jgi:signal transduction histidine kinase
LIDANEMIREMIGLLRGEAGRYSISICTELAAELPSISADRVQLQQVLMNLMLSAMDAIKERGVAGAVTVRSCESQDHQVLISVSDTGVGFLAGRADKMFDAFFTTKPQGTGMRLSISRSIIKSHGRRLWASANSEREQPCTSRFRATSRRREFRVYSLNPREKGSSRVWVPGRGRRADETHRQYADKCPYEGLRDLKQVREGYGAVAFPLD